MLIVQNMLGVCRLWVISFYISDMFLEAGFQVRLVCPTYERLHVLHVRQ